MQTTAAQKYTYDDYAKLPEGAPYQLINGELVKEPAPTADHQDAVFNLAAAMREHARQGRLGKVFIAPIDVRLSEYETYQPDAVFVSSANRSLVEHSGISGAPDLVVEALSPSTAQYDLWHKRRIYEQHGVREYWIVDPVERIIEVYSNEDGKFVMTSRAVREGLVASTALAGFSVRLSDVFALDQW